MRIITNDDDDDDNNNNNNVPTSRTRDELVNFDLLREYPETIS